MIRWREKQTQDGAVYTRTSEDPVGYTLCLYPDAYNRGQQHLLATHSSGVAIGKKSGLVDREDIKMAAQDLRAACDAHAAKVSSPD